MGLGNAILLAASLKVIVNDASDLLKCGPPIGMLLQDRDGRGAEPSTVTRLAETELAKIGATDVDKTTVVEEKLFEWRRARYSHRAHFLCHTERRERPVLDIASVAD